MGPHKGFRNRIFRAIHAEAVKRGLDHDALHDMCTANFAVKSMSDLSDTQLVGIYRNWTGKTLKNRAQLPRNAEPGADLQLVSGEELISLEQEFAKRGWGKPTQENFIRRQLRGRTSIRTRGDWRRVFNGVRAINKRENV